MAAATLYAAVDAPFALLFLGVMGMIAGPELVAVPALFFFIALGVGGMYRARIAAHARTASNAGNRKAGLLVETIEGGTGTVTGADSTWTSLGTVSHAGTTYQVYEDPTHLAQLLIDAHLTRTGTLGA